LKLDTKQKVLIAIYTEYQKDLPKMEDNITPQKLGIPEEVFNVAIDKLQNEEFITGANISICNGQDYPDVFVDFVKMTRSGIDYVENVIGIDKLLTGIDKVKIIITKMAEWGFDQLKDIAARTLSEMSKL
jgi:hypothetical protein